MAGNRSAVESEHGNKGGKVESKKGTGVHEGL